MEVREKVGEWILVGPKRPDRVYTSIIANENQVKEKDISSATHVSSQSALPILRRHRSYPDVLFPLDSEDPPPLSSCRGRRAAHVSPVLPRSRRLRPYAAPGRHATRPETPGESSTTSRCGRVLALSIIRENGSPVGTVSRPVASYQPPQSLVGLPPSSCGFLASYGRLQRTPALTLHSPGCSCASLSLSCCQRHTRSQRHCTL